MRLYGNAVTDLACQFEREISRVYNEKSYPGYPPDMDLVTAQERLAALHKKLGEESFKRVIARWEQELIPGIDY